MQQRSDDRRIQKTRKALHEALISLMYSQRYDAILIQDILDRANVGRSTFYAHFRGKDELLVDGLDGLRELLRNAQLAAIAPPGKSYEHVIGFSLAMFIHAYAHAKIYRSLVGGPGWIMVGRRIEEILVQLMEEEARPLYTRRAAASLPYELFIHFLGTTFMSVLTWWFSFKQALPPEEINALFRQLVIPILEAHLV